MAVHTAGAVFGSEGHYSVAVLFVVWCHGCEFLLISVGYFDLVKAGFAIDTDNMQGPE